MSCRTSVVEFEGNRTAGAQLGEHGEDVTLRFTRPAVDADVPVTDRRVTIAVEDGTCSTSIGLSVEAAMALSIALRDLFADRVELVG